MPIDYYRFHTNSIDEIDGLGNVITPLNKRKEVYVGYVGFGDNRQYVLVNSSGVRRSVSYNEFYTLSKSGKIIGSRIAADKYGESVTTYKKCNVRLD